MGILRVSLFGTMRVARDRLQDELKLTQITGLLLAYLLLERHYLRSREMLIGRFWGEYSQKHAWKGLNTALWKLHSACRLCSGLWGHVGL